MTRPLSFDRVFVAAEVGINHNGSVERAHRAIDAAADAGADAVKFQSYRTEDFVHDRGLEYEYELLDGTRVRESQYDMFKRCELDPAELRSLREHCDERGVVFFATPTSAEGVADLVRLGAPMLKNGSDYLGHLPLIEAMARTGLPTVVSTGMATFDEVDEAVRAFRGAGGSTLVLLHCTSAYPTPPEELNLRRIPVLADAFGCVTGLSDHSDGTIAAVAAVALGARFVEKHFTLDRALPGPDHRFSADQAQLRELVRSVRYAEVSLGSATIAPTSSEEAGRRSFRLSCVAARDLAERHVLTVEDIAFRRPGTGLPPRSSGLLVGRRLRHAVAAGALLGTDDVE